MTSFRTSAAGGDGGRRAAAGGGLASSTGTTEKPTKENRDVARFATINHWTDDMEAAKRWCAELLGVESYFERPGPDGRLDYAEFRIGDHQHELGLIDRGWEPSGAATEPGGAVMYWHVDDIAATFEKLLSMGAKEYQPITPSGEKGFVTAAVVDPFGNVLGIMYNPH